MLKMLFGMKLRSCLQHHRLGWPHIWNTATSAQKTMLPFTRRAAFADNHTFLFRYSRRAQKSIRPLTTVCWQEQRREQLALAPLTTKR